MAKKAKMAEKGKTKGKKSGPTSSDRVIKTRSMDREFFSPEESEAIIKRQSEIRNDFSDWLSIANRTAQDVSSVKKVSPSILRSNIVRNLENSFEKSNKDVEEILGSKKRIDIEFKDIAEEDEVVKVGLLTKGIFIIRFQNMEQRDKVMHQGYVFFDIKPMFMKPWNPIDDFTKEEVTNVPTWIQLRGLDIKY
uniref:DUF4283 domain-containing protein n=1 Tax=Cannabis sativa TaxID=3483 RepID=A0A803PSJ1_CANSA